MKLRLIKKMGSLKVGETFYPHTEKRGEELIEIGVAEMYPDFDENSEPEEKDSDEEEIESEEEEKKPTVYTSSAFLTETGTDIKDILTKPEEETTKPKAGRKPKQ